jgi:glutaconate CoA-transferase subunit B
MRSTNPELIDDGQSVLHAVSAPNPVSGLKTHAGQANENWMGFSRVFDNVWSGARHALVGPSQIDRFGQSNISALGGSYASPKVQLAGRKRLSGEFDSSRQFLFCAQTFSSGVCRSGNATWSAQLATTLDRLPKGYALGDIDIRQVITRSLCAGLCKAPHFQPRITSLHPGVTLEEVRDQYGL